jgi:ABC-type amino acid transport substrate-binding protein
LVINFTLILFATTDASAKSHLTVLVPNFPPYTLKNDNKISGIGIELANKVFKQAGINVNYRILPNYAKALHELEQGRGDAILLVSKNDERDNIAVFTKPLMLNRWCWYLTSETKLTPHDANFKNEAKISSHFKTKTHKWLIENNYAVVPAMKLNKLPQMLLKSRVDAVFIAELVFEEAMKRDNIKLSRFKKYVEIEKPFGIYISKKHLAKNPDILDKVNQAIEIAINH